MSKNTDDKKIDTISQTYIERCVDIVLKFFQNIGMALVIIMTFATVAHSIGRYLFHLPIPGIFELSGFIVLTMVFLSGAYNAFIDGQISIDSITKRFSEKAKFILTVFIDIICLSITICAMWQSIERGLLMSKTGQSTDVLRIPVYPFLFLVAFGWGLFVLCILTHLYKQYLRLKKR